MSDIVRCSWSGGKDSTCATFLHLDRGDVVKAVCYIPMFTDDIPLIQKNHYEFILNTADKIRDRGGEVFIVHGMTFYDFFYRVKTKVKNAGKIMGFPCFKVGACDFKNYSKIKAVHSVDIGHIDYEDIGIAYDEVKRQGQLTEKTRSILVEEQFTEKMAFDYCRERGLISQLYEDFKRDGCAICPQAPKSVFAKWIGSYPEARPILLKCKQTLARFIPIERH